MGRIRLALLLVLLVTLPAIGIGYAAAGLGPDQDRPAGSTNSTSWADSADSDPATNTPGTPAAVPSARPVQAEAARTLSAQARDSQTRATETEAAATRSSTVTSEPAGAVARTAARIVVRTAVRAARVAAARESGTGGGSGGTSAGPGRGGAGSGPIRYGVTYRGFATFYAADGGGSCSFPTGGDLMVGAMNAHDFAGAVACGAYVAVRAAGGKQVTIRVSDRCPECPQGAIDLSRQAFTRLAPASAGRVDITWHLLSPALSGPVAYTYKSGSSRYWCAIQVRNHRNPIASLQVRTGSSWKTLPRAQYNYFESTAGAGCGGTIRITDIYGNRLTDPGISISPGRVQPGHAQLPAR